ncbi:hypothetical protein IT568_00020 [bacterium]|nr:hypothetical protein [bacterium]
MTNFQTKKGEFLVTKFLGKGKSGYSYLAENKNEKFVLKIIHDEPCHYYTFGDKLQSEIHAYGKLKDLIKIPKLIFYEAERKFLLKEYFEGETIAELVANQKCSEEIIFQMLKIAKKLEKHNLNIDYFPTNFVFSKNELVYVDYEFNVYDEQWNFENWGIFYWLNSKGMKIFLETKNILAINQTLESAIPVKEPFLQQAKKILLREK